MEREGIIKGRWVREVRKLGRESLKHLIKYLKYVFSFFFRKYNIFFILYKTFMKAQNDQPQTSSKDGNITQQKQTLTNYIIGLEFYNIF